MKIYRPLLFLTIFIFIFAPAFTVFARSKSSFINSVHTSKKVVALTFDADMTPKMLNQLKKNKVSSWYNKDVIDVLEKANVPATLFLTGMWVQAYPEITTQLSSNTLFEIANHSYSHPAFSSPCYGLSKLTEPNDLSEITKTEELLSKQTAHHSNFFRFPGLCYDDNDLELATSHGYIVIGGDVHGNDGFEKNTSKIVSQVVSHVKPGSIVVMHMMGGPNAPHTGDALPAIIEKLKKEGYEFVTVSQLLKLSDK